MGLERGRHLALVWFWAAAALFAVGAGFIGVGASVGELWAVQFGVVLCLPMILVYYAALCLLVFSLVSTIVKAITAWITGVRRMVGMRKKGSAWSVRAPPEGVWDREIDG